MEQLICRGRKHVSNETQSVSRTGVGKKRVTFARCYACLEPNK